MEQNAFVVYQSDDSSHAMGVTSTIDGSTWETPPQEYGRIQLGGSPGFSAFNGKFYVAFKANDTSNALYVTSSVDGQNWVTPAQGYNMPLGSAPSVAAFKGKLYIAYKSTDSNHSLCLTSSSDGINWADPTEYSGIQISQRPAMAAFNGKLYIAFQANDDSHMLYVTSSSDGVNWQSPAQGYSIQIGGGPALVAFSGQLFLAYQSNDGSNVLCVASSEDGADWTTPVAHSNIKMGSKPSFCAFDQTLYLAFRANDDSNDLNITSSADGITWTNPVLAYGDIKLGDAPVMGGALFNDVLSGGMFIYADASSCPEVPDGCVAIAYTGPDSATSTSAYPILTCNGNQYWAYNYTDNRNAINIVMYDYSGSLLNQWSQSGTKNLWCITTDPNAQTVSFLGQNNTSVTMSWDALQLSSYQLTFDDLLYVANYYGYELSSEDAASLAAKLPVFNCASCCSGAPAYTLETGRRLSANSTFAIGQLVCAIAGAAAGAIIGGPAGAVAGFGIGLAAGANIGEAIAITNISYTYTVGPNEAESTYVTLSAFTAGPFSNSSAFEDIFRYNFPRYGAAPEAGALGLTGNNNQALAWYPATNANKLQSLISSYQPYKGEQGDVYKFIFVIVDVSDGTEVSGKKTYQMRLNAEDYYPDSVSNRVNHSQLTEGSVFAALMGQASMQNYGAGSLFVLNGEIMGVDDRSGHYFYSFDGKGDLVIQNALSVFATLGYDTKNILTGTALNEYFLDNS